MEQVERPARRHEQESGVFDHPFCLEMQMHPGFVETVADVMIELLVLLLGDLRLGTGPQRRGLVERLLLAVFACQNDRDRDVIGIGGDDAADLFRREETVLALLQSERDLRPARQIAFAFLDLEVAFTVRAPAPCLVFARLPADDLDFFGDHEGGIKTDAELTDLTDVCLALLELGDEGGRARAGDGAEILH